DPFCIVAPLDSRLPGGGSQMCGLYDVKPTLFGRVQNVVSRGDQTEIYNGFDLTGRLHLPSGGQLTGGLNTGRTETDRCFVVDSPQELRFCHVKSPFQPNVKLVGTYPLPWFGLQTSGVFQLIPGPAITASYTATNAQVSPFLGRNLASGANG